MAPSRPLHCIICGAPILDADRRRKKPVPWLAQFRAVYHAPTEVRLSGVGLRERQHHDDYYRVPIADFKRWDDSDCRWTLVPVLTQRAGRYGFVFHDTCWNILEKRGRPIPLDRLMEVLNSVPLSRFCSGRLYTWGHGYHGLLRFNDDRYPWQQGRWTYRRSPAAENSTQDPYSPQEVEDLLNSSPIPPPASMIVPGNRPSRPCDDCFTRLPQEIVQEIASYLPTTIALRLRLLSWAFVPLFFSQGFWASRFRDGGDREFLSEVRAKPGSCDWRTLYRQTNRENISPALQNRKRIWDLAGSLLQKLVLQWAGSSSRHRPKRKLPEYRWRGVHGNLTEIDTRYERVPEFAQLVDLQETLVPSRTTRVGASIIRDGDTSYVAGIQLFSAEDEKVISLGYTAEETTSFVDANCATGFIVSVGREGIHALQPVKHDGSLSPWLGCPDRGGITRRLVFKEPVVALSAGFDGYKMIHLSAWGKQIPATKESKLYDRLVNNLIWFPEVPEPNLCLNETSSFNPVPERPSDVEGFRIMCCSMFGGPGGAYLRFLTGFSVIFDFQCIASVEFFYTSESIPHSHRRLGRRRHKARFHRFTFDIDGPRGEFIDRVDLAMGIHADGLMVSTNWGRSYTFENICKPYQREQLNYRRIEIAPGTVPTGLYAYASTRFRFHGFGIVSEAVPEW